MKCATDFLSAERVTMQQFRCTDAMGNTVQYGVNDDKLTISVDKALYIKDKNGTSDSAHQDFALPVTLPFMPYRPARRAECTLQREAPSKWRRCVWRPRIQDYSRPGKYARFGREQYGDSENQRWWDLHGQEDSCHKLRILYCDIENGNKTRNTHFYIFHIQTSFQEQMKQKK